MNIVIVGLGVIGASFAMGLKEAGYTEVYGIDKNIKTLEKAEKIGIIRKGYKNGEEVLKSADFIIISLYPRLIEKFIKNNINNFKDNAVITDVTGIKEMFIENITEILPENVDFIFGHPMAGREKKGIDYATNEVFKGANYIITPIKRNKANNIKLVRDLAYELGFKRVKEISSKKHDEMIAFTSQLPHAIAVALINSDIENRDTGSFIGDSYRDLTRIANINEDLWSELFLGNKENLLECMDNFNIEFQKIRKAIWKSDEESLKAIFKDSTYRRENLEMTKEEK